MLDYKIIPYESYYRDDLIFMVLEAKDALGKIPRLNDDLLDIEANYLKKGNMFWLAVDSSNRVIGSIGFNSIAGTDDVILHRLYVKANLKRKGIGTALLNTAEAHIKSLGKKAILVHLGGEEYFESYSFYPKHGYEMIGDRMMRKML